MIRLPRRKFLQVAAGVGALAIPRWARAQPYPSRSVRIIVGFPAGGTTDILGRLVGQWLGEHLGQSFVIENRPGGGTNIATEQVVRAAPDGHTLLLTSGNNAVNASFYHSLNFVFLDDIDIVAGICREPLAMLVHPSVPAATFPEFIAYAKANPGKLTMASGGIGAPSHLAGEMLKQLGGIEMVHVPYRGAAPALTDLLAGQVNLYFSPLASALDHIQAGRLRAIAVTSEKRSAIFPAAPTIAEFVPGYEASQLYGVGAPKDTPREIIELLNKEINAALASQRVNDRLAQLGVVPLPGPPATFRKILVDETEKWAKVVKVSGAKAE